MKILKNPAVYSILIPNLVTMFFAIWQNWDVATIVLVYWAQSIIIGFFFCITLLTLKLEDLGNDELFTNKDVSVNTVNHSIKLLLFIFFIISYGGFHYGYFTFIQFFINQVNLDSFNIFISILLYFLGYLYTFLYYKDFKLHSNNFKYLIDLMFSIYKRIIPIHMTILTLIPIFIITSFFPRIELILNQIILLTFLGIKTYTDVESNLKQYESK
jgi:hypothetical protein